MLRYKIKREILRIIHQISGILVPSRRYRKLPLMPQQEKFLNYGLLSEYLKGNILHMNEQYYNNTIDVIIPVYNGFHFLERLFKSLPLTRMKYRWIIIDDKSTDERVLPFLRMITQNQDNCILIENEVNLGFVRSVNKAFSLAENHIALVNTDIEVPEMWLELLMYPIITDSQTASATPFTNSGTLCSFPTIFEDNSLYLNLDLSIIAEEFRVINPKYVPLPNGVGFCMGMSLQILKEIGSFDADTFDKGYGEECDWCQRAINAGYKNVLVENLFVYHKHGGSFPTEQKKELLDRNLELLGHKHPNIFQEVTQFSKINPHYELREYLKLKLLKKISAPFILIFEDTHTNKNFRSQLKAQVLSYQNEGRKIMIISNDQIGNFCRARIVYKEVNVLLHIQNLDMLREIEMLIN